MTAVPPAPTFSWQRVLPAVILVEVMLVLVYADTAAAMVGIWWRSETFNHAFLVPLISLWLIWEKRELLARLTPCPVPWLAVPFAMLSFVWLLGELAAVNAVTQFALVAMLVLAVPLLIGIEAARSITFPLAFLFFSVPFGEFVMPTLMDWTATFTVLGLRASGIPVYQEGLHFIIPSGRWSVVEACSGVRYLIASIVVGTLYAYLNYTSLRRRLVFVGVSILVPLVANWVRAYLIVMLGHLSGNELATGADHLIYGWVFFGLVMLIMFAIGLRWREQEPLLPPPDPVGKTSQQRAASVWPALAMTLLIGLAVFPRGVLWLLDSAPAKPAPVLDRTLLESSGWQVNDQPLAGWQPAYANPSATLDISLQKDGRQVGLFVAYYRQQHYDRKLISSSNVLVKSSDKNWAQVGRGMRQLALAGQPASFRTAHLRDLAAGGLAGEGARYETWYAYWIGGRWVASDAVGKLWLAWNKLSGQGDDSAVVFLYAPLADVETALTMATAELGDRLPRLLDAARNGP